MINNKIIKIASNTKFHGLNNIYTHKASIKNRKCGDKIDVEINIRLNKIKNMRYETESCIFCQASASILASKVSLFSIKNLKDEIDLVLSCFEKKKIKLPKKLNIFKKIINKNNASRLDCIILPFKAIKKALKV